MRHPSHARYLVHIRYGSLHVPSRYFETRKAARRYARGFACARVQRLLLEREARALYALACVVLFALFAYNLGA